jgi:hypothetical protein
MFEIILRDPEPTSDNPFKISFFDYEEPVPTSKTIFVMWICEEGE